ncbi:MAG: type II toxin-antitoxin system RelE/ParE family toxin [Halopseudomonas aestusnigri]
MAQEIKHKTLTAFFYKSESGAEPVRDEVLKLATDEKKVVGQDIKTVEFGWPVGLPVCRNMGNGLWEVRSKLPTRIFRVLFGIDSPEMVLLHGFIKKTQKTPQKDIDLATKRWKSYLSKKKGI